MQVHIDLTKKVAGGAIAATWLNDFSSRRCAHIRQLCDRCAPLHYVCSLCINGVLVSDGSCLGRNTPLICLEELFKSTNLDNKMMSKTRSAVRTDFTTISSFTCQNLGSRRCFSYDCCACRLCHQVSGSSEKQIIKQSTHHLPES